MGRWGRPGRWVLALAVLGLLGSAVSAAGQGLARPDLVLVLADDMTEADWQALPRTAALLPAAFPNYFNVDPLCCPSRATVLRGQYPHTHGTLDNELPHGGWPTFRDQEGQTIAVELQRAGYRTGLIGKYLNGYEADGGTPPGWDYWFAMVNNGYFDWDATEGGELRSYGNAKGEYSTDVIASKAAGFIRDTPTEQPLFAYVAPHAPHINVAVAPRHRGDCKALPLAAADKPSFNEPDMSDKPAYMQQEPLDVDKLVRLNRERQCSLKAVDELVVGLVAALDARGRPYDLVFATDNGFLLGEHRRREKIVPYEESIRTTMRAVGPDFPAGEDRRLVGNLDLAATFADAAGAPARADWDGRSILSGVDRELIGIEAYGKEYPGSPPDPPYHGFRTGDGVVYVEYASGEVELYDLGADPFQLDNLAAGKAASDFPAHHARLDALRDCGTAACWAAEDEPLATGGGG